MHLLSLVFLSVLAAGQSPLICEDTISAKPPFNGNDVPCLLGCGSQIAIATGSLLPGSVNLTAIPYCRLDCVHKDANSQQSSAAPQCNQQCEKMNSGTPEQLGWCMYWCVEGIDVATTTCVPSLEFRPATTSTIQTNFIVTVDAFTQPATWLSWYQTQTVISRSSLVMIAPTSSESSPSSATVSSSDITSAPTTSSEATSSTTSSQVTASANAQSDASNSQQPSEVSSTASGATKVSPTCIELGISVVLPLMLLFRAAL